MNGSKEKVGKVSQWENKLWSYLNKGDGIHCPIYHNCQVRRRGGSCFEDHKPLHQYLRSVKLSNPNNFFQIISSNADYANFLNHWVPGKVFQLVEKLATKYLNNREISNPPVPTDIISLFDPSSIIKVHLLPLKTHSGAVWKLGDKWVIQLRKNDSINARRFTLFHEAFHILAHCKSTPVFNGPGKEDAYFNEILADYFSCCMLMPRAWITEHWRQINNIKIMANIFNVLESQMWVRVKQLHLQ